VQEEVQGPEAQELFKAIDLKRESTRGIEGKPSKMFQGLKYVLKGGQNASKQARR
jgi:hypothetical protein